MKTKTCVSTTRVQGCGRDLSLDSFYVAASGVPHHYCKDCGRRRVRIKKNHPELLEPATSIACVDCGETKASSDFAYAKGSGGQLRKECRKCVGRAFTKNYSEKMRERHLVEVPETVGEKRCPRCARSLPLDAFHVELRRPGGRAARCRECCSEYFKERRKKRGKEPKVCLKCQQQFVPEGRENICPPCRSKIQEAKEKVCKDGKEVKGCGQVKRVSEFSRRAAALDGRFRQCKSCHNAYLRDKAAPRQETRRIEVEQRRKARLEAEKRERLARAEAKAAEKKAELEAGQKLCLGTKKKPGCGIIKPLKSFGMIKGDPTRRISRCHACCRTLFPRNELTRKAARRRARKRNPGKFHARKRLREARKLQALPKWLSQAQRREIFKIYEERARISQSTGVLHHVDHIIPLRGREEVNGHVVEVWGLHVPWNLRVIPAKENEDKSNKFLGISQSVRDSELKGAA